MTLNRRTLLQSLAVAPALHFLPGMAVANAAGGSLVVGLRTSEPRHLNPGITTIGGVQLIAANIYSALTRFDPEGNPIPDLAESWNISEDGQTYTFNLAKGVTWHDGTPFTSADVKFSFEDVLIPLHPVGKVNFGAISAIETPDDTTVVFRLSYPYAAFLHLLELRHAPILPKHIYQGTEISENAANLVPVGTGPFKLAEWAKGSFVRLEKNPSYFKKDLPHLDQLVFVIIPDTNTMIAAMEADQIAFAPLGVSFGLVDTLKERLEPKGWAIGTASYLFRGTGSLLINTQDPALKDVRVRQAIAHLVRKQDILATVRKGVGKVAENPISWFIPNAETAALYAPDVEAAKKLLNEAGLTPDANGTRLSLTLVASTGWAEYDPIASLMRDWFAEAGIAVTIEAMDEAAAIDRMFTSRQFQLGLCNPSFGPDPAIMAKGFTTAMIGAGAYTNGMGYSNPDVDVLFDAGARQVDPAERHSTYKKIVDLVMADVPVVPLYEDDFAYAYKTTYEGLPPGGTHRDSYENVALKG